MAEQSQRQRRTRYSVGVDKEKNNGIPIAANMPRGMQRPPSMAEMFQAYLKTEQMDQLGLETPEDADDFEPDWDEDVLDFTIYELAAMQRDDNPIGADPDGPVLGPALQEAPQEELSVDPLPQEGDSAPAKSPDAITPAPAG